MQKQNKRVNEKKTVSSFLHYHSPLVFIPKRKEASLTSKQSFIKN